MNFREWMERYLWRSDTGRKTRYPFYATDLRFISGYGGEKGLVIINPRFKNILMTRDKTQAAQMLGLEPPPKGTLTPGRIGPEEAQMLSFDEKLGDLAKEKGYDLIHYTDSHEVQIINMGDNTPREWDYNDEHFPALTDTGEVL